MQNSTPTISWQLLLFQRPSHVPSKYLHVLDSLQWLSNGILQLLWFLPGFIILHSGTVEPFCRLASKPSHLLKGYTSIILLSFCLI